MSDHSALTSMRPVQLVGLFPDLHHELMTLLRGLAPQAWNRPTACARWSVQDIVAHLLDTCFRRLSLGRDQTEIAPPRPLGRYGDLVAFLNQLNAEWVIAARRLSPRMLMDLMEWAEPQL
ncbi:MAG TPA: maleylpyruvate isomerase N-terminal domain-containing protein, partial [Gemmatimonadales bacterium]|nr:maleylpyruvate isomerase N-terminal domain-containing protein [Gemmatimonadales bacterium]